MTLHALPSAGRQGRIYERPPSGWLPCSGWMWRRRRCGEVFGVTGTKSQTVWVRNLCLPGPEPFHTLFLQFYCTLYTPLLILSTLISVFLRLLTLLLPCVQLNTGHFMKIFPQRDGSLFNENLREKYEEYKESRHIMDRNILVHISFPSIISVYCEQCAIFFITCHNMSVQNLNTCHRLFRCQI